MHRMQSGGVSSTAAFVCQGRAAADGRIAVDRYSNPVARLLLTPEEQEEVNRARQEPHTHGALGVRARISVESVTACAEVVVPRTVAVDDAVRTERDRRPGRQTWAQRWAIDTSRPRVISRDPRQGGRR